MADIWFTDYVLEHLERFGGVTARRMFGGQGLFKGGLMFALIADGQLFFKVDDSNRADFEAVKSQPFTYDKKEGKTGNLSYWYVPDEIIEDPDELKGWAAKGIITLSDCKLFSACLHEAKPLTLRRAAIDNLPRFGVNPVNVTKSYERLPVRKDRFCATGRQIAVLYPAFSARLLARWP